MFFMGANQQLQNEVAKLRDSVGNFSLLADFLQNNEELLKFYTGNIHEIKFTSGNWIMQESCNV